MRATVIDALRRQQDGRSRPLPAEALEVERPRARG